MKQSIKRQSTLLLIFLGIFGFSIGLFDNYRELWMNSVGLSTETISHIISVSYLVTVLILLFFTIRVPTEKLKDGILISLVLRLITGAMLVLLKSTNLIFWTKFTMFFDIAFTQLILASIYPLLMNLQKGDVIYTKKSVVEALTNKLGFLFVSIFLGKIIFGYTFDYNTCLLLSEIFAFLAFLILLIVKLEPKEQTEPFSVKNTFHYFKQKKIFLHFLLVSMLGNIAFDAVLGMRMLRLVMNFGFTSSAASFLVLTMGILTNIFAMLLVKKWKSKSDFVNLFVKFGMRLVFYVLILITANKWIFLAGILYMFLTESTHSFLFDSFFINQIDEKYSLFLTTLKYCVSLIGSSIGVFLCGFVFEYSLRILILPSLIIGMIHYILAIKLIQKKQEFKMETENNVN